MNLSLRGNFMVSASILMDTTSRDDDLFHMSKESLSPVDIWYLAYGP